MKSYRGVHANGFIHTDISKDKNIDPEFKTYCLELRTQILTLIDVAQENLLKAKEDILSRPVQSWSDDNEFLCIALQSVDDSLYKTKLINEKIERGVIQDDKRRNGTRD